MALLPKVKLKTVVSFPAAVFGGVGVAVRQVNGQYFFDLNYSEFMPPVTIPTADLPNTNVLTYNVVSQGYTLAPYGGGGGGVPEAPTDGSLYGRQNVSGAQTWAKGVKLAGDTMTGPLVLPNTYTTIPQAAIPKSYVDYIAYGSLVGLTLSTAGGTATFGIASGIAGSSTATDWISLGAITKTTAPWAVGNGNGAWDGTGANPASSGGASFHVFAIKRTDTQVSDALISPNNPPTLPTNYDQYRRIGSMKTNASNQWMPFVQVGDEFHWTNNFADAAAVTVTGTTANIITLSVPTGVQVNALFHGAFNCGSTASNGVLFTSLDEADVAVLGATGSRNASLWSGVALAFLAGDFNKRTDTSGRIRWRAYSVGGGATPPDVSIYTYGWIDRRGRETG